ncbi:hypothetical protein [Cerasicoccus frondis]|uniref:hypothetical protein n=1 Tax=Cerasicoccus frondis TaxID=490090 RepID=UPI00285298DC|nr:hypothetical protein [Cerasicoccus frondis]
MFFAAILWWVVSEPLGVLRRKTLVGCVAKHWGISSENTSGFCQFAPEDFVKKHQWVLLENTGGFGELNRHSVFTSGGKEVEYCLSHSSRHLDQAF